MSENDSPPTRRPVLEIIGLDHLVLRANDPERLIDFYANVLGCEVERELPEYGLVQLRAGSALIDIVGVDTKIGRAGGRAPDTEGHNVDHFCLLVDLDEEALRAYLIEKQIDVPAFEERYGATGYGQSIYITDPEGNIVELKLATSQRSKTCN